MAEWQQVESVATEDGAIVLTVFDGEGVVSIELLDYEAAVTAQSCASSLGFGTVFEPA